MSLLHAVVAYNGSILVEVSAAKRDFSQAVQTILSKIPPNNSKLTYVWEQYLFHYVSEGGYTYLVMTEEAAGRRLPFTFLDDLQLKFQSFRPASSSSASSTTPAAHNYTGFRPTLATLLQQYNTDPPQDAIQRAKQHLAETQHIMEANIESVLQRGERIDLLVDKTDTMASQSWAFRQGARTVRRQQFWRNQKILILTIAVGVLFTYIFIAQFCGAGLNHCRS